MAIRKLTAENFTVFENIEINFCDGVNVFIGRNGTGKTHLLKILYATSERRYKEVGPAVVTTIDQLDSTIDEFATTSWYTQLLGYFQYVEKKSLHRNSNADIPYSIGVERDNQKFCFASTDTFDVSKTRNNLSVFIPAKEMLTHSRLEKDYVDRNLPFDKTLIDIFNKSGVSTLKSLAKDSQRLLEMIANIIGGKVIYQNDKYYIDKNDVGLIEFAIEADGYKKLGLIYRLIETGHLGKGSALFWDEPESNIDRTCIPDVVDILLTLAKHEVQIFLSTHDYLFAKYFEVKRAGGDSVLFHSLYKSDKGIQYEYNENFRDLKNNPIISAFDVLMDEVISKNMGD